MKIVIGSIQMEANTFSPLKADVEFFKNTGWLLFGDEIVAYHENKSTEVGGFIKTLRSEKAQMIPTISAHSACCGKVTWECFQFLKNSLLEKIQKLKEFDAVLLALHGSMVAENVDDPEGELLAEVRNMVGKKVPIVATLDLHANVTQLMVKNANALIGYSTQPHIDMFQTGKKGANLILSILKGEVNPTMAMRKIPMMVPGECTQTTQGPMAKLMTEAKNWEKEDRTISCSIFAVQPWLDIQDTGWSIAVITDNDFNLAQEKATELAQVAWDLRHEFRVELTPVEEAIRRAKEIEGGPLIFDNTADSVSCGAPGDNTTLLKALINAEIDFPIALIITDHQAVEKCIQQGVGRTINLQVGGKIDTIFSEPLAVSGKVKLISDGKYTLKGPVMKGVEMNMGRTVILTIKKNINLVITEFPTFTVGPEQYRSVGLEPKEMKIVEVKSPVMFRASYERIAKEIIMLDTPGIASPRLTAIPFKNIKRPMYPFDDPEKLTFEQIQ